MSTETGLAIIETSSAMQLFAPGFLDPIVERVEREAREEAAKLDISTAAGRKAIASLSFKVGKSKTFIDGKRKELVSDEKRRLAKIDAEGRVIWNRLEALQDEVRKPLTEWEEFDSQRIAKLEFKVVTMAGLGVLPYGATSADIEAKLAEVDALDMSDMQEFTSRAELAMKTTRDTLNAALAESKRRDAEVMEAARLRAEAADRERRENEERIAREAREKAQREAEAERQRIEEEKFQAEARAKAAEAREKAAAERAAQEAREAEERRVAAEAKAVREAEVAAQRHAEEVRAAEARAEAARKGAAELAERERVAAVEAERARAAEEQRAAEVAKAKREANEKHCAKINRLAVVALMDCAEITEDQARVVIAAIAKGSIPAVKITY